ncbi:MAG: GNAT family N-acetyltransferase [Thermoflexibacter sp.]
MEIEIVSAKNLSALIGLVLELWTECSYEEELKNYQSIIDSSHEICLLAKVQEQYIAFIHLTIRNDYVAGTTNSPVAYIEGIYVKPNFQKRGVAKALITVAENWAKQKGLKQIASDTEITNLSSIYFHKKVGFSEVERIVCFVKDLS